MPLYSNVSMLINRKIECFGLWKACMSRVLLICSSVSFSSTVLINVQSMLIDSISTFSYLICNPKLNSFLYPMKTIYTFPTFSHQLTQKKKKKVTLMYLILLLLLFLVSAPFNPSNPIFSKSYSNHKYKSHPIQL